MSHPDLALLTAYLAAGVALIGCVVVSSWRLERGPRSARPAAGQDRRPARAGWLRWACALVGAAFAAWPAWVYLFGQWYLAGAWRLAPLAVPPLLAGVTILGATRRSGLRESVDDAAPDAPDPADADPYP